MKKMLLLLLVFLFPACLAFSADLQEAVQKAADDVTKATENLVELRKTIATLRIREAEKADVLRTALRSLRKDILSREEENSRIDGALPGLIREKESMDSEIQTIGVLLKEWSSNIQAAAGMPEQQKFEQEFAEINAVIRGSDRSLLEGADSLLKLFRDFLNDNLGGCVFKGSALNREGRIYEGTFLHAGPADYFISLDGKLSGIAETEPGRNRPSVTVQIDHFLLKKIREGEEAEISVDFTMGRALQSRNLEQTWFEHIERGGIVMIPILALGLLCLVTALFKFFSLARLDTDIRPMEERVVSFLKKGRVKEAEDAAGSMGRPASDVFLQGIEHRNAAREEIEEIMRDRIAEGVPFLEKYLAILSVSAAASPLLGLLGTVMGMIHTFNLITIFGTGKARLLSSGISEALITTEYGLIIAIPALLIHAYLTSRIKKILNNLEQGVSLFVTRLKNEE